MRSTIEDMVILQQLAVRDRADTGERWTVDEIAAELAIELH